MTILAPYIIQETHLK